MYGLILPIWPIAISRRYSMGIAMLALLAMGCTSIPSPNVAVSDFGVLNQSELITLESADKTFAFTARIESDGSVVRVVAITPTGQRLFSLEKRGEQLITEPGPLWPSAMPLAAVWADVEIAHVESLAHPERVTLAKGWQRYVGADGMVEWSFQQQVQARVQSDATQTILRRPNYTLSIEVLAE